MSTNSLIKLTPEQFKGLRPMNGHIIVKSSQDMTKAFYKSLTLKIDVTYKPEHHQEIFNIVIKVPDNAHSAGSELWSSIKVVPGDRVIVNYFPILQAPIILVEDIVYKLIPYSWVICQIGSILDGKKAPVMLNDYVMVDKVPLPQHELELDVHKTHSKFYVEVTIPNINEDFIYVKRENYLLYPKKGDIVSLKDMALFPLEPDNHLYMDGRKHYVTKAWKIISIVEPLHNPNT